MGYVYGICIWDMYPLWICISRDMMTDYIGKVGRARIALCMNVLSPEKNSTKRTFCLGIKLILRLFRQKAFLFLRSFDIRIILIRWYFCRKINLVLRLFELILILILCSFDLIIFLLLWSFDEKCFLLHNIFFHY